MRILPFVLATALCFPAGAASAFAQSSLPSLSDATIAPSGREIAFVSGGDIWTVPAAGGEAHLLVSHPATESRPLYSPDGSRLAFVSTRTGAGNIYILTLATGELKRLTFSESPDRLDAWSADSQWIYFNSSVNDVAGQGDIFRVHSTGGTPLEVSAQRYMNEFQSAPSPDGTEIAIIAKGISNSQWWRNGHAHIDETEVWLKPVAQSAPYKKLLSADAKHAFPMWSPDGGTLYFMSDASGSENLWAVPVASPASAKELTHFKQGRVLWPTIGAAGKTIVFERDFSIWSLELASGKAAKIPIELRGASPSPAVTRSTEAAFRTLAVAPDGKKLLVTAHGQLFAASAKDGGEALRLKTPAIAAYEASWSPDSMSVVYAAERIDGARQLELYDFRTSLARPLTTAPGEASNAVISPDGKLLAYLQNDRELHVLTLPATKDAKPLDRIQDRLLAKGELRSYGESALAWSPDSQWIAFPSIDSRSFRNLSVVPAAGGEPRPITFLANGNTGRLAWSPDGKFILFATGQRSERQQIARVDLLPHVPRFREDEFADLFRPGRQPGTPNVPGRPVSPDSPLNPDAPASPAPSDPAKTAETLATPDAKPDARPDAKKKPEPTKIVFEGIRNRLTLLPLDLGAEGPVISPDGKVLLFAAESGTQLQLLHLLPRRARPRTSRAPPAHLHPRPQVRVHLRPRLQRGLLPRKRRRPHHRPRDAHPQAHRRLRARCSGLRL